MFETFCHSRPCLGQLAGSSAALCTVKLVAVAFMPLEKQKVHSNFGYFTATGFADIIVNLRSQRPDVHLGTVPVGRRCGIQCYRFRHAIAN
jgi:hypothetical protein